MSQIHSLARLQTLDSDILAKKTRLAEVLRLQKEPEPLLTARAAVEQYSAKRQSWQTKQRDLDLEIGQLSSKIKQVETKMYSGKVTSPKELSDLEQNVASLKRHRATLEDSVLDVMVQLEDVNAALRTASDELEHLEANWVDDQARYKEEQHTLAVALNRLLGERKEQASKIDARLLINYDSLRRKKAGVGAVAIVNGQCSGCRVVVPSSQSKQVREGNVVFCGQCGRILLP
jgi:predicted  nucleic acid-binding Zn-ribbon protein